jgi:hypothetical protein
MFDFLDVERYGVSEENQRQAQRSHDSQHGRVESHVEDSESGRSESGANKDENCYLRQATLIDKARQQCRHDDDYPD